MKKLLAGHDHPEKPGVLARLWDWSGSFAAYRIVQVVVLVTAAVAVWLTYEQAQAVECNTRYNRASAEYDQARAGAAQSDREALRALVEAVIADDATAEKTKAAGRRYLDVLDRTDQERSAAPVIPPPADFCR